MDAAQRITVGPNPRRLRPQVPKTEAAENLPRRAPRIRARASAWRSARRLASATEAASSSNPNPAKDQPSRSPDLTKEYAHEPQGTPAGRNPPGRGQPH